MWIIIHIQISKVDKGSSGGKGEVSDFDLFGKPDGCSSSSIGMRISNNANTELEAIAANAMVNSLNAHKDPTGTIHHLIASLNRDPQLAQNSPGFVAQEVNYIEARLREANRHTYQVDRTQDDKDNAAVVLDTDLLGIANFFE